MKFIDTFSEKVKVIENQWIPMKDGVRLAARIWLPEEAEKSPVPTILEYIPYRKRDHTRNRDTINNVYFAGHGYACIRVDIRGSGDSEGVIEDEYLPSEQEDGLEILRWIAAQPWSDGKVGMIGISWGGFNGLQIAALNPPELKAIVSVCSTDDRYADDVHYMGGCLLGDNLSWASVMFSRTSLPPDPEIVGEKWRDMWLERLDGSGLWLDKWLQHQRRDEFWKHGSICEDFSTVTCPILAVSGWADGYSNAVFRLVEGLSSPCKGLIGPWSHKYPHQGEPGPAIGFLQECLRWWDRWLKDEETGVENDPDLRVWMQDSIEPRASYETRPGRWVAEQNWPAEHIEKQTFSLAPRQLLPGNAEVEPVTLDTQSPLILGLYAGKWCSYAAPPDLPGDQRSEDGGALIFESEPLEQDLEILGAAEAELELSVDKPVAMIALRLSDVAPEGPAARVTYGILNLTHRESHEYPEYLEPGKRYTIRVRMNEIAQLFPKGNRIRLSVSTSYWPLAWTPPELVRMTLYSEGCSFSLPVRTKQTSDENIRPFEEPEAASPIEETLIKPPDYHWHVIRDLDSDVSTLEVVNDRGEHRIEEIDLNVRNRVTEHYTICGDDTESAEGRTYCKHRFKRGDWETTTITRTKLTSTVDQFHIHATLDAYEGDKRIFSRNWDLSIDRDFV